MARYLGPKLKLSRREGSDLNLKSARRSFDSKVKSAEVKPGQHGKTSGQRLSDYGTQLREKQKAKRLYGLLEKQFSRTYVKAERMKGATGENMLILLERRLDNVVYKLGLGSSRSQARQIVNHGHITVNGKCVNIPSYVVKAGDVVAVKENRKANTYFKQLQETKKLNLPKWLEFDIEKLEGKVLQLPERADVEVEIAENMIVELYSR